MKSKNLSRMALTSLNWTMTKFNKSRTLQQSSIVMARPRRKSTKIYQTYLSNTYLHCANQSRIWAKKLKRKIMILKTAKWWKSEKPSTGSLLTCLDTIQAKMNKESGKIMKKQKMLVLTWLCLRMHWLTSSLSATLVIKTLKTKHFWEFLQTRPYFQGWLSAISLMKTSKKLSCSNNIAKWKRMERISRLMK